MGAVSHPFAEGLGSVFKMSNANSNQVFRKRLMGGASMAAILAVGIAVGVTNGNVAYAGSLDPDGDSEGNNSVLDPANDGTSTLDNTDTDGHFGEIIVVSNETVASANFDNSATLYVTADVDGSTARTLTVTAYFDIASGKTLTLILGDTEVAGGGVGTDDITIALGTTLGEAGATTLTRGGTLAISGVNTLGKTGTLTVAGNTLMTTISQTAGIGGNDVGFALVGTYGDSTSGDTFNVTTFTATGAAGAAGAAKAGGSSTVTVTAAATIGTGGMAVEGGISGANTGANAGGAATATMAGTSSISGAVTVLGGAANISANHDGADGGAAALTFTGTVTSTSTLTITGGAGDTNSDSHGDGGAASVTITVDATFSAIELNDGVTRTGSVGGVATLTFNGSTDQTITGAITANATTEGTVVVNNTGSAGSDDVKFVDGIGVTGTRIGTLTLTNDDVEFDSDVFVNVLTAINDSASANFDGNLTVTTGNITIGTDDATFAGNVTLDAAGADIIIASGENVTFDGTGAQAIAADINGAGILTVSNTGGTVTITGDVGTAGTDLGAVRIVSGATLTIVSSVQASGLQSDADVDADGAGARGGTLTISGANTLGTTTAGFSSVSVIDTVAKLSALNLEGGDSSAASGDTGGVGGITTLTLTGNADITTVTVAGGAGGAGDDNDADDVGGTGGSSTLTVTGTLTATNVNVTASAGATGGAGGDAAAGSNSGAGGGATLDLNNNGANAITTLTITAGNAGDGGAGDDDNDLDGGIGGNGAAAAVTVKGDLTAVILNDGEAGSQGTTVVGGGTGGAAGTSAGAASITYDGSTSQTTSGTVTAAADNEGLITIANTTGNNGTADVTFSSAIGTSSAAIKTITITDGDALFSGNVYARTITMDAGTSTHADFDGDVVAATALSIGGATTKFAGDVTASTSFDFAVDAATATIIIDGTGAQTITGAITTSNDGVGELDVTNTGGTVTFASAIGAADSINDMTLATGSTTVFKAAVYADTLLFTTTANATFEAAVALDVGLTTSDAATITLGSTFIAGTTVFTSTGSEASLDQTADTVTLNINAAFTTGTLTLINDTNALDATDAASFNVNDTALVNYTVAIGSSNIEVSASKNSATSIASSLGVTTQEGTALREASDAVASGDATGLAAMTSVMNTGGAGATKAAEQVSVQADTMGADTAAAVAAGGQVLGAASTRLASLRSGAQYASAEGTGFATGGERLSKTAWFKPFGNLIKQGTRNDIKGYDADTYGVAADIDGEYTKDVRLGVSFAYSESDVDGKGSGQSQTDVKSYQGMVYGDYTAKTYYVEGMIAYARNESDTSRLLDFGGLNRTIVGNYNSNQYMVKVSAGAPNSIKGAAFITPTAGLSWTHVSGDSYTETGGGGYNQIVNPEDVDVIVGSVGVKFHTKVKSGNAFVIPELRGGLNYDFAGDEAAASATYTGGGAAFTVTGAEVAQFSGNAGLGLTFIYGAFSVAANYDTEIKADFISHTGTFEARFKF